MIELIKYIMDIEILRYLFIAFILICLYGLFNLVNDRF